MEKPENILKNNNPKNDYKFDSLTYPLDLGSESKSHYMTFFINQVSSSKYSSKTNRIPDEIVNGSAGVDSISPESNRVNGIYKDSVGTSRSIYAIALPIPAELRTSYKVEYDTIENNLSRRKSSLNDIGESVSEGIKHGIAEKAGSFFGGMGGDDARRLGMSLFKEAINPHMEQLFKGVPFRDFQFSWKLVPKTEKEVIVIDNIVKMFKFHSLPEMKANVPGRFFIYPSEFDIVFYHGSEQNKWLNKISTSACVGVDVNYTSSGMWQAFRNGFPVELELGLSFTELEIMTKERIRRGY